MTKETDSNPHFSIADSDMSPITDLSSFNCAEHSAILIDLLQDAVSKAQASDIATSLPDDYKAIYLRKEITFIKTALQESLRPHLVPELLRSLMNELCSAMDLFYRLTRDEKPLASMRVVTQEYITKEYPSVSQYYHRDAAAMTLTKCFYGEGAIYIREKNTKRDYFQANSIALNDADAAYDKTDFHVVPPTKWILLKGEMYEGIDSRNQSVIDIVLGKNSKFTDFAKGKGLIHKGGRFIDTDRRLVFTLSTYKTEF
ncbi:DUF1826 domain-containing protein [Pseudomonas sp. SWRI154]|uniref:DUF1826 domain-containing protein n=1 Tax=Pseudomonas sp. SWRI154 TaxID=2745501 RepID=UPI001646E195|nr:DUF1826 domain-containing protein [Pseudomonas sp. SWRI154]MBC3365819.1 DUF1826 domain-containing protein [Pseudomonas sp. SWRI154]